MLFSLISIEIGCLPNFCMTLKIPYLGSLRARIQCHEKAPTTRHSRTSLFRSRRGNYTILSNFILNLPDILDWSAMIREHNANSQKRARSVPVPDLRLQTTLAERCSNMESDSLLTEEPYSFLSQYLWNLKLILSRSKACTWVWLVNIVVTVVATVVVTALWTVV